MLLNNLIIMPYKIYSSQSGMRLTGMRLTEMHLTGMTPIAYLLTSYM